MKELNSLDLDRIIHAILQAQTKTQWKPEKAKPHLIKRIRLGHLPENATLKTYKAIIHQVIINLKANIYVYLYESFAYPTVTSIVEEKLWLVMRGITIMNKLLNIYHLSLDYPNVSGAEHLELLAIRDQIAELEVDLKEEEQKKLSEADRKLILNAPLLYQELSRFINLADYRKNHNISSEKWWWYLDVLSYIPTYLTSTVA